MGKEIPPMSQERRHGGGKEGRASVTCAPDSCGIHSLIGVIDTVLLLGYFSACPKRACIVPLPEALDLTVSSFFKMRQIRDI